MWCGYAEPDTLPQALLFRSTDALGSWHFAGVFYLGGAADMNRVDCPDMFAAGGNQTAFLFLDHGQGATRTVWMLGAMANATAFTMHSRGVVDYGSVIAMQSFTDMQQRRVQLGWISVQPPGSAFAGAQSLPRVVEAVGASLYFRPHPAVATLHGAEQRWPPQTLTPGQRLELGNVSRAVHVSINITLPAAGSVTLELDTFTASLARATHTTADAWTLTAAGAAPVPLAAPAGGAAQLDVFMDRVIVEVFANGGAAVVTTTYLPPGAPTPSAPAALLTTSTATVAVAAYAMGSAFVESN